MCSRVAAYLAERTFELLSARILIIRDRVVKQISAKLEHTAGRGKILASGGWDSLQPKSIGSCRRSRGNQKPDEEGTAIGGRVMQGHKGVFTRRGISVAELRSFRRGSQSRVLPDREVWPAKFPQVCGDSGELLEEERS